MQSLAIASVVMAAGCAPAESSIANAADDNVIGIIQCDEYLTKVSACVRDKAPADQRDALNAETRQLFVTWKEAADHPQHRATLPQACAVNLELAKEEFAPFGCSM